MASAPPNRQLNQAKVSDIWQSLLPMSLGIMVSEGTLYLSLALCKIDGGTGDPAEAKLVRLFRKTNWVYSGLWDRPSGRSTESLRALF